MQKIVAVLLIALLAAPAGAHAQDALINRGQDRDVGQTTSHNFSQDLLRKAVARKAPQSADAFSLAPFRQQSQQRSWAGRHPVLLGALVGAGFGVGYAAIERHASDKQIDFPIEPIFGLLGAVFGGAVGFIVSLRR